MSLRWWAFSTTIIAITGASGLIFLVSRLYPSPATKTLLFILLLTTFSSGAVPISIYLNHRFAARKWFKQDRYRLVRHALESGLLMAILAYLQLGQNLDWTIAAVLVGVFILMETFFLTRN